MASFHQNELQKYCRVCGKLVSRNRVIFSCEQHKDIIWSLGLWGQTRNPSYNVLMRWKKATESGRQYQPSVEVFSWKAHSQDQCTICQHFNSTSIGGRPKKKRNPGRPATISTRRLIDHAISVAPPSFFTSDTPTSVCESGNAAVSTDLLCPLCSRLLDRPVQLTVCNKLVCLSCLHERLEESGELICPCCNTDHVIDSSTVVSPTSIVVTILGNHKITCTLCALHQVYSHLF